MPDTSLTLLDRLRHPDQPDAWNVGLGILSIYIPSKMLILGQLEGDLLDLTGELETAFVLVGWIDRSDRVASDFERLQPVPEEGALDLALADRLAVDGHRNCTAAFFGAVGPKLRFQRDISFRDCNRSWNGNVRDFEAGVAEVWLVVLDIERPPCRECPRTRHNAFRTALRNGQFCRDSVAAWEHLVGYRLLTRVVELRIGNISPLGLFRFLHEVVKVGSKDMAFRQRFFKLTFSGLGHFSVC